MQTRKPSPRSNRCLKQHPHVGKLQVHSKDAALDQLKQSNDWGDVMDGLERNPLPDAFVLSTRNTSAGALEALRTELVKLPQVEHAQLDSAWAKRLDALLRLGRAGGIDARRFAKLLAGRSGI